MPKDKNWETIFEEPKTKKGVKEYSSVRKYKRFCDFENFHHQTRLKRRREKALKRGWKPLSKKKQATAERRLEETLLALDQELIVKNETADRPTADPRALLDEPVKSKPENPSDAAVTTRPTKDAVMSCAVSSGSEESADPNIDLSTLSEHVTAVDYAGFGLSKEDEASEVQKEDPKSSESDSEFFTPCANKFKASASNISGENCSDSGLSAIVEDQEEVFSTPSATTRADGDSCNQTQPESDLSGVFPVELSP